MTERCAATLMQRDDHWGGVLNQCEDIAGHDGEHHLTMNACEPIGYLRWSGSYDEVNR